MPVKPPGDNLESLRLHVPGHLAESVREEAARRGVSLSEVGRLILQDWFDRLPPDHPYRRRHPDAPPV